MPEQVKRIIGLRRHTVAVIDHQSCWAELAAAIRTELLKSAEDLLIDVQHVGSTAVPGLPAKPIIDIAAAIPDWHSIPEIISRFTDIGYIHRGFSRDSNGHLFVRESSPEVRTVHLHVVEYHGTEWKNYLRFRDLLRQDREIRRRYAALKNELRNRYGDDRKSYTASKNAFIRELLDFE